MVADFDMSIDGKRFFWNAKLLSFAQKAGFGAYLATILISWKGLGLSVGIILAFSFGIQAVFEIPSGTVADKVGRARVVLFGYLFYSISFLIYAFAFYYKLKFFAYLSEALLALGASLLSGAFQAWAIDGTLFYLPKKGENKQQEDFIVSSISAWEKWGLFSGGVFAIYAPTIAFPLASFLCFISVILIFSNAQNEFISDLHKSDIVRDQTLEELDPDLYSPDSQQKRASQFIPLHIAFYHMILIYISPHIWWNDAKQASQFIFQKTITIYLLLIIFCMEALNQTAKYMWTGFSHNSLSKDKFLLATAFCSIFIGGALANMLISSLSKKRIKRAKILSIGATLTTFYIFLLLFEIITGRYEMFFALALPALSYFISQISFTTAFGRFNSEITVQNMRSRRATIISVLTLYVFLAFSSIHLILSWFVNSTKKTHFYTMKTSLGFSAFGALLLILILIKYKSTLNED